MVFKLFLLNYTYQKLKACLLRKRHYSHDEMKKIFSGTFRQINRRAFLLHVLSWGIFITYELGFLYYADPKFSVLSTVSLLSYYAVNIAVFYSALDILNNTFHQNKRPLKSLLLFLSLFLILMVIKSALSVLFEPVLVTTWKQALHIAERYVYYNAFRGIYFCALAVFYWVAGNIAGYRKKASLAEKNELITQKENAELEQRFSEVRNAYLQQQLNPHLLFNSLSFIYSSVYAHSPEASRCVILLSDIMRFSLDSSSGDGKTFLIAEMEQVKNLIELNRYRFEEDLCLHTLFEVEQENLLIIPLVLLTLTENLFKHGQLTDPAYPAVLEIRTDPEGVLRLYSRNRKAIRSKTDRRDGLGLQNTRIRLEYSYPGRYTLEISEDEYFFEQHLTLSL